MEDARRQALVAGRGDFEAAESVSVVPDDTSYVYRALSVVGLTDLVPTALGTTANE